MPKLLRFLEVLFIIDDIIANEGLDKKRQAQNSEKMIPTILKSGSKKKKNDSVWLADPKDNLYQWIKKLPKLLRFLEVLFIIDDIIANEGLYKKGQAPLELSISGRHQGHYLWLLTQSYSAIPKNLRRQSKAIFMWYPKERKDLKMIHDEKDVLTDNEVVVASNFLRKSKHASLYIPNEFPRGFRLLNHV